VHKELHKNLMSADEQVFTEPWGFPHKRLGPHRFAPFVSTNAIAVMKETWKPRDGNRYLVIPQGFTAMDIGCLDAFVALAEWKNIERLEQEQCANPSSLPQVPIPSRFFQRVLEMRATAPEMDMPVAGPMGHSCFISKLPPELHPAVTHVAQESAPSVGLDERVAVFCGDPRYLIMKEMTLLPFISRIFGGHVEPDHFVTASMRHSQDLESMVAWARLEHLRPHQVRLFFAEDFVLEPETAFRGLARFLGIDHACDVLPTIMHQLPQLCSKGLFQQCNGPEIEFIEHLTGRFEQELAKLPMDIQRSWQDQVSNLINLPNARLSTLGRLVAAHERWELPRWWIAHCAQLCKPCTFATRGLCRNGELCGFCHAPDHQRSNRPSKKERQRRDRRRQAMARTPSPPGLSS